MHEERGNKDRVLLPLSLFLITVITRIPFTGRLLYHTDSVHFALALDKFDITLHQPHPPGYFLYIMLGRFLNIFIEDANTVFVTISVVFSGLAVITIYFLGKEIYDSKIGFLAAAIAITSPSLWFHGEVALSYAAEAFFSAAVAFFCWKIYRGEHRYIWLSVIALGIAGGIRQNTLLFLLPLWLFSVKGVPIKIVVRSFVLLGVVCLLWFVPMVKMTGGLEAYRGALRELWLFHTGRFSVFERGWEAFGFFSQLLFAFTVYGTGSGTFILGLAAYSLIRNRNFALLIGDKAIFFLVWMATPVLFYLLIFIHPSNPGYVMVFLPALFILIAVSIEHMCNKLNIVLKKRLLTTMAAILAISNMAVFFYSDLPVSFGEIRNHDKDLETMLNKLKGFDPSVNVIFVRPYSFFNYRHIMYYLPEYRVYQVDVRIAPTGEVRKTFFGAGRKTFLTYEVILPQSVTAFVLPLISEEKGPVTIIKGIRIINLETFNPLFIAFGDIALIKKVYPQLNVRLPNGSLNEML